jgi:hypothetical protein
VLHQLHHHCPHFHLDLLPPTITAFPAAKLPDEGGCLVLNIAKSNIVDTGKGEGFTWNCTGAEIWTLALAKLQTFPLPGV